MLAKANNGMNQSELEAQIERAIGGQARESM